jgi:NAD(P)-dependent dehydrogenase (short-subunit alcohol dehydrogenase family)
MAGSIPHGARSTANQVIAGVDLTRKWMLVTGCDEEVGFETMNALTANGAHVFGLASSLARARSACDQAGPRATPVECDLADLDSVAAAAQMIRGLQVSLDAILANAELASPPTVRRKYGVELQFLVNHIGHFALVNQLLDLVRNGTGRIVIASSSASVMQAPPEGISFDNLDGHRSYDPMTFYGQSKFAVALYAKELSRRLHRRAIAVNSLHPGAAMSTALRKELLLPLRVVRSTVQLFVKSASQRAATGVLLAASPCVAGITGEYWSDCQVSEGNPLLNDGELAQRLWQVSMQIVRRITNATRSNAGRGVTPAGGCPAGAGISR